MKKLSEERIIEIWHNTKGFPSEETTRKFIDNIQNALIEENQKELDEIRLALKNNIRCFLHVKTGRVQYALGNELECDWKDTMIIPNISNESLNFILGE